ncbi:prolipoprotein diacylglyceryl transferase family protein [Aestuariivivens sp. NBU2969]|uniref:prolipoprotein diacylglyceryl transferase family protein n=1 Tax=Aestuariivivens sp. NBU2969 TaxID=2873267 RepID=UPI001CBD717D|nr:prolipoprotein diacylglyceryl transferase family protein [Aestuariivivens sp. NBU2969]
MSISIDNPNVYFKLFYLLAFTFIFLVVIYKSIKRGYHLRSVLLMLTTISLFTVIGSRLFTIPIQDWLSAISTKSLVFNNRSAIGGLLFGLVGLAISQRVFGFNRPMLDLYAWIGPFALGILKFGCLVNGCCYGLPFKGFWAVHYPKGTHAHFNQWYSGLIENEALLSLSVHPVQLYESLLLFSIGYIVWKTHKLFKKNASALLFGLFLFFTMRFGIEFLRDPNGSQFSSIYYWGLRSYQWSMLGYAILTGLLLWIYETHTQKEFIKGLQNSPYIHVDFIYIICISLILYTFRALFSSYELLVVWIKFIPAILLSLYYLYSDTRLQSYRVLTSVLLLAPFYIFAQTIPNQMPEIKQYKRIDFGASFGDFANEIALNPREGECGTSYDYKYYKQVYQMIGLGYSQVTEKYNRTYTYGINLAGGNLKSTNLETKVSQSDFMLAANPFYKIDGKWIGAGIGLQLGKLRVNKDERLDESNIEDAQKDYNILPEFYFRIGPRKYLDVDFNYGFMMPSAYPTLYSRSSIGSSLGLGHEYSFRYGRILNLNTGYVSAEALITDQFGINLMYVFKDNSFDYLDYDASGKLVFSLNYRFGHKTK